ncbi:uncharacterized protein TM35_000241150 [Trypanosoma theileri]|uniref:C3H1-type domain-containing protein n=1 Tax=Trypanosoma theileri TaxID=67003 RepID=A0A1X0NQH6_9TRYP|nr:uncharacterized protein TM35_000241150 [Trypanosoma theileri]ORC86965.1 hypothetical protein TM35_000241150 [Trypanosoma theileri]
MGGTKGRRGTPKYLLSAEDTPEGTFAVIDPLSQRLFVPQTSMIDTLAMHRAGVPSLCRLYLQGRCRQGNSCFQAHADANVVQQLREVALKEPTCCEKHGAKSDTTGVPKDVMVIVTENNDQGCLLRTTLAYVTMTKGLRALLKRHLPEDDSAESVVVVPLSSLCRLHGSGPCCRFGHECNFVHLCRDLIAEFKNRENESDHENVTTSQALTTPPSLTLPPPPPPPPLLLQVTDASPVVLSPSQSNTKNLTVQNEPTLFMGISPVQFASSQSIFLGKHTGNGVVSLSGTPKLSTSPALSRSYNSTSLGIVWRHNPYGGTSSASSVVET